ncbi:hypothetical protein [Chitinimonas sp.]|uniref:hypothetical protein n=1 Tax=Chitinimonas sp. TaxID=1934313 RepID=UPI002F94854C
MKPTHRLLACLLLFASSLLPARAQDGGGPALQGRYAVMRGQLGENGFKQPLYLTSHEASNSVDGEIYALLPQAYGTLQQALSHPTFWCEILLLHLNTKHCHAQSDGQGTVLQLHVGKRYDQAFEDAYRFDFAWHEVSSTPDYLQLRLNAEAGPYGTRDYQILFEAVPVEGGHSFIHLSYAYGYGLMGKLALGAYLNTVARGKVGFSQDKPGSLIGGARGLMERNTMRYFLAIDAALAELPSPPRLRAEQSLKRWFEAVEQYPRQLHELEWETYIAMKRKEYAREWADGSLPSP